MPEPALDKGVGRDANHDQTSPKCVAKKEKKKPAQGGNPSMSIYTRKYDFQRLFIQ